jgi:GMP synthase (glutamine-hydrolysing)
VKPVAAIWILNLGDTPPSVAERHGGFDRLIRGGLGLHEDRVCVAQIHRGEDLPEPEQVGAVVLSGSSAMLTDREDWSERTAAWLLPLIERQIPVLGICYGHQLLAHALGGRVSDNPRGREIGTVEVALRAIAEDPLFSGLPELLRVQATHVQSVLEPPPSAECLGSNGADPHHVLRFAERAWGVQFHPEFDAAVMRGYLAARAQILSDEGRDVDGLSAATRDSPHGAELLRRFGALACDYCA